MNSANYTIRKIAVNELPRLTELFNYNDIDGMLKATDMSTICI